MIKDKENIHKGHRQRMRDKFREIGFKGWSEVEVLEYMLYNVYRQGDTNPIAHKLLQYGGHNIVELMRQVNDVNMMEEIPGVGESTIMFLQSLKEFMDFYHKKELVYTPMKYEIHNILDIIEYVEFDPGRESLVMLCTDDQSYVRAIVDLTEYGNSLQAGTTKSAISKAVAVHKASGVIFIHNHPTGVLLPSYQDVFATAQMESFLTHEHVVVLDHVVVCGNKARSILYRTEYEREVEE